MPLKKTAISDQDTIFGKILRGEIPATIVYEEGKVLGFKDIAPQAPVHVPFIPKQVVCQLWTT